MDTHSGQTQVIHLYLHFSVCLDQTKQTEVTESLKRFKSVPTFDSLIEALKWGADGTECLQNEAEEEEQQQQPEVESNDVQILCYCTLLVFIFLTAFYFYSVHLNTNIVSTPDILKLTCYLFLPLHMRTRRKRRKNTARKKGKKSECDIRKTPKAT